MAAMKRPAQIPLPPAVDEKARPSWPQASVGAAMASSPSSPTAKRSARRRSATAKGIIATPTASAGSAGRKGRPRQSHNATAASATTRKAPYGWIAGRSQAAPAAANAQRPVRFSLATRKRSIASAAAKTYSVYIRANVP